MMETFWQRGVDWHLKATTTRMQCFMVEPRRRSHSLARSFRRILLILLTLSSALCWTQEHSPKRKVIIDQDAAGPAGTDQQSMLLLIQSPQTEVLGITVVTGRRMAERRSRAHLAHAGDHRAQRHPCRPPERNIRWSAAKTKLNSGSSSMAHLRG